MSSTANIVTALKRKAGFECLPPEDGGVTLVRGTQLRLLGRVSQPAEKSWKRVRHQIQLAVRAGKPWTADISRWYFLLDGTEQELFAWRLLFQAQGGGPIDQHLADILETITAVPVVPTVDVMEFPIPVANQRNLSTAGGKRGAGAIGTVPIGPGAKRS